MSVAGVSGSSSAGQTTTVAAAPGWWRRFAAGVPGPIFQKEVWVSGRRSGVYWVRGLYAAGLLALVLLVFLASTPNRMGGASELQAVQRVAPAVSMAVAWFQFIVLPFAAILFAAPAICEERRAGTLAALLTTPLKAWQIVLGKVLASFVQLLILCLVSAPLLLAIRVFGGVTVEFIGAAASLSLATALLGATLGTFVSIGAKRSPAAIASGMGLLVGIMFLLPGILLLLSLRGVRINPEWFWTTSPPLAMGVLSASLMGGYDPLAARSAWTSATAFALGGSALAFCLASFRLRAAMARDGGASPFPNGRRADAGGNAEPGRAADAMPKRRRRGGPRPHSSREVGDRPVLWREVRQRAVPSRIHLGLLICSAAALLGTIYHYAGFDEPGVHYTLLVVGVIMTLVGAAASTTSGITGEREARTLDPLIGTPLSAWAIVGGKFAGALRRQWPVPAAILAHLTISAVLGGISPLAIVHQALLTVVPAAFLSSTGVMLSVVCRRTTVATSLNFGIAFLIWTLAPIIAAMVSGLLPDPAEDWLVGVLGIVNPAAMTVVATGGNCSDDLMYKLFSIGDVGAVPFTLLVVAQAAMFAVLTYGVLRLAAARLAAQTGRAA